MIGLDGGIESVDTVHRFVEIMDATVDISDHTKLLEVIERTHESSVISR